MRRARRQARLRAAGAAGDGPGRGCASIGSRRIATLCHPIVGALPLLRGVTKSVTGSYAADQRRVRLPQVRGLFARTGAGGLAGAPSTRPCPVDRDPVEAGAPARRSSIAWSARHPRETLESLKGQSCPLRSKPVVLLVGIAVAALGLGVASTSSVAAAAAPTWQTTFRDNFDGSGLPNSTDWQFTLGTSYPGGPDAFGTGEIETLTKDPKNVDVRGGNLVHHPAARSGGRLDLGPDRNQPGELQAGRRRRHARGEPGADAERHRAGGARATGRPSGCWAAPTGRTGGRGRASANSTSWRTSRA